MRLMKTAAPSLRDAQLAALGLAIRTLRKEMDLSQESLAHLAEIDRSHMGKIERGERNLTFVNLVKIARVLRCQPSDLLRQAGM